MNAASALHAGLALHLDACHPAACLQTELMAWRELAQLLFRCLALDEALPGTKRRRLPLNQSNTCHE